MKITALVPHPLLLRLIRIVLTTLLITGAIFPLSLATVAAESDLMAPGPVENWIAEAKDEVWGEYPTVQNPWPVFETAGDLKDLDLPNRSNPQQKIAPEITITESETPIATPEATSPPQPTVVTPTPPATSTSDWSADFLRLTNAARETNDLSALAWNVSLCQAADIRVNELPVSPSPHLRPDGDAFYTVLADINLAASYCGENYAIDPTQAATAEQIVTAWLNSPTHRKNILNSSYTQIAFSKAVVNGTVYYEQLFIG